MVHSTGDSTGVASSPRGVEADPAISIIVVSYNTRELTRACLESIFSSTREVSFEVIVVDNASGDGSADMVREEFPSVRLIASTVNHGFARANNLASREARGRHLLLLNPDTVVLDGAVDRLHAFAVDHAGAGVVGGRTLHPDGSLNPFSCRGRLTPWSLLCQATGLTTLFRRNRLFDPESLGRWERDTVGHVDIVVGCFFMVSRELWERLDGFDPSFFMYGEEADFCLRARKLGFRPMITPNAEIIHYESASEPVRADKMVRLFSAQVTLIQKHWSRGLVPMGKMLLCAWAGSRALGGRVLGGLGVGSARDKAREWAQVFRRRSEWLHGFSPRVPAADTAKASRP